MDRPSPPNGKDRPPHVANEPGAPTSQAAALDAWIVPPDTAPQRKRGRGSGRRTAAMHPPLHDLVEEFCTYERKLRGRTEGGVRTYRWNLGQLLAFVRTFAGRLATVDDLTSGTIHAWMAEMAKEDLALSTMRTRQSTVSSFCIWLV